MHLLPLVFLFPLVSFTILAFGRGRISENIAAYIGVGSMGLSALTALFVGYDFLTHTPESGAYLHPLWTWMSVGNFTPTFTLKLDGLSLVMLGVITGVGFFIHLFASWYMRGDDGYGRFLSYMNLFVASMLFLVLGDDLLFLYFGWEGVGLCSYLLIGFWYKDAANGAAARKAFIITRVGDTFMAIGLFILYREFGTLNIDALSHAAPQVWEVGAPLATIVAFLLLGGAVGKSAQLPLQTWLPDAMAGPTPVSALIHAATMVTAGVYLIARTHVLFELSPLALQWVGIIGAVTLLLAGFTALMQTDIKKILAYSTMSQIGYMFLAEGAGAYQQAVFHLMTHAFFKALLFLSSGSVILAMHHEQDIFRMGNLRKHIPFVFWCMFIGTLALCAFPFTSGFYSKDEILHEAYLGGHYDLWAAGLFGAFLTGVYSFRLIFIVFFGPERWRKPAHGAHGHDDHAHDAHAHGLGPKDAPHGAKTWDHTLPLAVLLVFAILGGFIHLPLDSVLPVAEHADHGPAWIAYLPIPVSFAGIALSWFLFHLKPGIPAALANGAATRWLGQLWKNAWGFDWLYDLVFTKPFVWAARVSRDDFIDTVVGWVPASLRGASSVTTLTQTGGIRWYAAVVAAGLCVLIAIIAFH